MTTDSLPDGPSRELRTALTLLVVDRAMKRPVPDLTDAHSIWVRETVDAILTEITRSGHSIIATDRLERLIRGGRHARNSCMTRNDGWMCNYPEVLERDLDPVGGGR